MRPRGKFMLGMVVTTLGLMVAVESRGTIGMNIDCPDRFVAKVKNITSPEAPSHAYSRVRVQLQVLQSLSGNATQDEMKSFEVLKYSDSNFESGATYEVAMRDKWLCRFKKVN